MFSVVPEFAGDGIVTNGEMDAAAAKVVVDTAGDSANVVEYRISYDPPEILLVNPSSPGAVQVSWIDIADCVSAERVVILAGGVQSVCIW